jgi:hypothetical protein
MKKIMLLIAIIMIAITGVKSQSLTTTLHASKICHKDDSDANWSNVWEQTNATFYFYKTGNTATNVYAKFDSKDNYTGVTTFTVYAENKVNEDNGFAYYLYVYCSTDVGTSKTYDKTEYFRIKDQIKENFSTIILMGYKNSTDWAWICDSAIDSGVKN